MSEKVICTFCQHSNQKGDIYCVKCGSNLPVETWDKRAAQNQIFPQETTTGTIHTTDHKTTKVKVKPKRKRLRTLFKPPVRSRQWYHPLEILFWIGWSFYILFLTIGVIIWFILREIGLFLLWCFYWGPPREWKREE